MDKLNNEQLEKLLEDISSMKAVINRNKQFLQQLLNPGRYRYYLLMLALVSISFSLVIFILMQHYGGYGVIPGTIRLWIHISIIAAVVLTQILKITIFGASALSIDKRYTFGRAFKELYSYRIAHLWVPATVAAVVLVVFFIINDIPYFIIPTVAVFYGLLSNLMGPLLGLKPALPLGYWLLGTGMITVVFNSIPAPLAVIMTYGCGMLLFSILSFRSYRSEEVE